jgi:hypothetical protein
MLLYYYLRTREGPSLETWFINKETMEKVQNLKKKTVIPVFDSTQIMLP